MHNYITVVNSNLLDAFYYLHLSLI